MKMTGKERVLAAMRGKPTDRRAVCLILSLYGARLTHCPLTAYYTDPKAYARGQSAVRETFQPDILVGPFAFCLEGQAFGSQVRFFENQAPNLTRPAISSAEEIRQLTTPDIDSHPTLTFFREAIRLMSAEHGQTVPIAAICLSPVDLPAMIMSIEGWLQTLLFDDAGTRRMLDVTIPYFIRRANDLLAAGATFIVMPNSFSNPHIVTREIAAKITIPVLKEIFADVNGPLVIHSGGAPLVPFLDLYVDLPNVAAFIVNGEESLAAAREKIGAERTLMGNLEGPVLWKREPGEIKTECLEVLRERRNDPYFILGSCGPDITFDTPRENIEAIFQALEIFEES